MARGLENLKNPRRLHGGARPKAGRRKGGKNLSTLEKVAARELVRQRVTAQLGPLIDAQIANALGLKYLVTRDKKTGKFIRVGEATARGEETIEVWEKDPSVQAFTDLLNRAIDKPADPPLPTGEGIIAVYGWRRPDEEQG